MKPSVLASYEVKRTGTLGFMKLVDPASSGPFGFTRPDRSASEAKQSGPFGFMRPDHSASEAKRSRPFGFMRPEAKRSGPFGLMRPDCPASKPVSQLHMTVTAITVMLPYLQ